MLGCRTPPLTTSELERIDQLSESRFDCDFWRSVNVQAVIRRLLRHIRHNEAMLEILKTYIWTIENDRKRQGKSNG